MRRPTAGEGIFVASVIGFVLVLFICSYKHVLLPKKFRSQWSPTAEELANVKKDTKTLEWSLIDGAQTAQWYLRNENKNSDSELRPRWCLYTVSEGSVEQNGCVSTDLMAAVRKPDMATEGISVGLDWSGLPATKIQQMWFLEKNFTPDARFCFSNEDISKVWCMPSTKLFKLMREQGEKRGN